MGRRWSDDGATMGRRWDNDGPTIFEGIGARLSWTTTCPLRISDLPTALHGNGEVVAMATAGPLAISNHTQLAVSIQAHKTSATINNPVSREQSQIDTIRESVTPMPTVLD